MPNNLYQQMNQNNSNNFQGMINEFIKFKNSFQGDPQQMVQQLLQSGKMSQAQLNYLQSIAFEFQKVLPWNN